MNKDFFNNINGYQLDSQQQDAITKAEKYSLIVAGAGSGKTLTLVGKIKYLLEVKNVKPEEILCISFTNESTNSLKEKIKNPNVNIFTFHKLAVYILKQEEIYYEITPEHYLENCITNFLNNYPFANSFLNSQMKKIIKAPFLTKMKYKEFLKSTKAKELKKTIATFISLYTTYNLKLEEFKRLFSQTKKKENLFLLYAILNDYEKQKSENHYYDFDDLIKKATEICNQKQVCNFKEIIIDEFQDTSKLRLDFVKSIVKNTNANLTVVGDDFQSIYKFSGCNLDIFLNFKNYFPNAKTFKIENTYRNSDELVKIAGKFIMKNHHQIKKDLKSNIHLEHPIKIVRYVQKYQSLLKLIKKINDEILILGRNNFDIYDFIPKEKIKWLQNGYFLLENYSFNLRYLTVHKSKGLESKNVIILNLINKELGFPCLRKNNPLMHLIQEKDNFLLEEERRLFYVAITRTKSYCYLFTPYLNSSAFVKEIKKIHFTNLHK